MNIAISFSGDGFGHLTRMGALAKVLKQNHEVFFYVPENLHSQLKAMHDSASIHPIPLLKLHKKNHKVQIIPTAFGNMKTRFGNRDTIKQLATKLKEQKIDAIIADYEPFLPLAAKKANIPIIQFNHEGVIEKHASWSFVALNARIANQFMMPAYNHIIVSSFYNGDVGPILRDEIKKAKPEQGDYVLVYLKPSAKDALLPALENLQQKFKYFPNKHEDFIPALTNCRAVIAPAGHQLMSEALSLKKPMLVVPEVGQYEQLLNAKMLKESGWGEWCRLHELKECIKEFLKNLDQYPKEQNTNITFTLKDDTENAIQKINTILNEIKN